jgi:uncharacterized membrane protein YeaQ/YmgE (transglycosylase-associated protein family)
MRQAVANIGWRRCQAPGENHGLLLQAGRKAKDVSMDIVALILYLIVAAVCAFIAEKLVPGGIPGGFFTSAIFGIIGAWIGGSLMGSFGPSLAGVSLVPCIVGSAILVFGLSFCGRRFKRSSV